MGRCQSFRKNFQLPINKMISSHYNINIHVHNTCSSGIPFYFAKDRFCHALSWINNIHLYKCHGIEYVNLYRQDFMVFHSILKNIKERFKDFLSARIRLNILTYLTIHFKYIKFLRIILLNISMAILAYFIIC